MQAVIADLVHPIFQLGIALRARLEAKEPVDWVQERTAIKELLAGLNADDSLNIDGPDENAFDLAMPNDADERGRLTRTTVRYALTAWLDEFISHYSSWGQRWRDATLEAELYGSRTRGGKFWDEARYAQTRGDRNALEVMYLCVMLGLRGDWRAKPTQVADWTQRTRAFLEQSAEKWTMPASLEPSAREATLPGDWPYRGMVFSLLMAAALVAPMILMVLWRARF